jgi:phage-related protein
MASIYEVSDYASGSTYQVNDIVKSGGYFWYALQAVPVSQTPSTTSAYWGGMLTAPTSTHATASNVTSPHFIWTPAYNMSVNHEPRVRSIKFGDGYEQRIQDGINADLIKISLTFDGRDIKESMAILHFLESRSAKDFFFFTPPSPYNTRRKFICRTFSSSIISQGVLNISASFDQVP